MSDTNPRGLKRPRNGRGGGKGVAGGRRKGKNTKPCKAGGVGKGRGAGRGSGKNR